MVLMRIGGSVGVRLAASQKDLYMGQPWIPSHYTFKIVQAPASIAELS
jgi:hypothetical protein